MLRVFVFNSVDYYLNIYQSHLLAIIVDERNNDLTVIQKASYFISSQFAIIQLLHLTTSNKSFFFLESKQNLKPRIFSPADGSIAPTENKTQLLPYDVFYGKFRSRNVLEEEFKDSVNLLTSGMTTD